MLQEYYKIYINDIIKFCKLIIIKFDVTADLMNELVMLKYGKASVDLNNPRTWKYYLNLSGEYHFSDTEMKVYSLDTTEEIIFNKANLAIHGVTRTSYRNLSSYYYDLVDKYPEQESLIRSILYPVDIDKAIAADFGTILEYPSDLIEPQEMTMIDELQTWIKNHLVRWHIKSFSTSDSLYPASYQAVLHTLMPSRILNLRMRRCKTREVHSFHIRAFLASHGGLDKYYDYLTLEQRLWLYRNICYIERNSGIKKELEWLIENILSKRKLPVAEFTARQFAGYDDEYYPNYHYRKTPLNTPYNVPEKDFYTLEEMKDKESDAAPYNKSYWDENFKKIDRKFKNSGNAIMLVKDMESNVYDYTNAVPYPLPEIILQEWAYKSFTHGYRTVTEFKHPTSNLIYSTTSDIAFIYMTYIYFKMHGIKLNKLPKWFATSILKDPKPTLQLIMRESNLNKVDNQNIALWLINSVPTETQYFSKYHFNQYCNDLFAARLKHWFLISNVHELTERAYVNSMVNMLFTEKLLDFDNEYFNPNNLSMMEWIASNNLPLDDFNQVDCSKLIDEIFSNATGYYVDKSKIMRYIHKAMISIIKQLTSYSLQWLYNTIDTNIRPFSWAAIRVGNIRGKASSIRYVHSKQDVVDIKSILRATYRKATDGQIDYTVVKNIGHSRFDINSKTDITATVKNKQLINVSVKTIVTNVMLSDGITPANWLLQPLTPEQITELKGT